MEDGSFISLRKLAYSGGISFVFTFIGYIVMFLFKLFAARYFGPSDFGIYTLLDTILSVGLVISGFGIFQGITRYIPLYETKGEKRNLAGYIKFVFFFPLLFSLIISTIIFLFSISISSFFGFSQKFSLLLRILIFALPLKVFIRATYLIFVAKQKVIYKEITINIIEHFTLLF